MRRWLPWVVGLSLLGYIAISTPWAQVGEALTDLRLNSWLLLLLLTIIYFAAKAVRYWYMLRPIGVRLPLMTVVVTYLSAQPVSLLPGGELFRNRELERRTGVPMAQTSPTFIMQGLTEALVIVALVLVGAVMAHGSLVSVGIVALVLVAMVAYLASGRLAHPRAGKLINALPYINVSRKRLRIFAEQHQALLAPKPFAIILAISAVAELAGIALVLNAVQGLGSHISWNGATLAYGLPILAGFLSLLPGGVGAADQTSISTLEANHVTHADAVAVTLLSRFYIVVLGSLVGAAILLGLRFKDRPNDNR